MIFVLTTNKYSWPAAAVCIQLPTPSLQLPLSCIELPIGSSCTNISIEDEEQNDHCRVVTKP